LLKEWMKMTRKRKTRNKVLPSLLKHQKLSCIVARNRGKD